MTELRSIQGFWYPAGSSQRSESSLTISQQGFVLRINEGGSTTGQFSELKISQRVGNIPRRITFSDQSTFETSENDAVDVWISRNAENGGGWMHEIESRWHWIGIALVAVVLMLYSSVRWGLPLVTEVAADHMPESVIENISSGSLDVLDKVIFKPSDLSESRKTELIAQFQTLVEKSEAQKYSIHFRKLDMPNAMALPNGSLVVTDSFAELASVNEFKAVMLHEIGHVADQHGVQQLIRSSIVSFVLAIFLGDPTGLEELLVGLPVFLMQSHYSRTHEAEADEYAFRKMMDRDIDPIHFASIMEKMATFELESELDDQPAEVSFEKPSMLDYLSSHPATSDRIQRARELSKVFHRRQ